MSNYIPATTSGPVDRVEKGWVLGWVWDRRLAEPVEVELSIDGVVVANATANIYRENQLNAGIGSGEAGFALSITRRLCDSNFHEVAVRTSKSKTV